MAATNASGTTTVRYGGMRAHVLELEVVLADGRIVRTGTRAVKSSAGYNLTNLFIGSEGTLGVITELTLRLHPIPDHIVVARAAFPSVEAACRAAATIIGVGVPVTALRAARRDDDRGAERVQPARAFPESPYLFVEFGGSEAGIAGDLETTRELAEDEGATAFESESDPTARAQMWSARHNALMASLALAPGSKAMTTDVAVPVSELAAAIEHARRALDESGLRGGIVGHVGDGNFHVALPARPGRRRVDRAGGGAERAPSSRTRSRAAAPAPASTASATASSLPRAASTATSCRSSAASSSCSTRNGIMNPGKVVPLAAKPRARSTSTSSSSVVPALRSAARFSSSRPRLRVAQARSRARPRPRCPARRCAG